MAATALQAAAARAVIDALERDYENARAFASTVRQLAPTVSVSAKEAAWDSATVFTALSRARDALARGELADVLVELEKAEAARAHLLALTRATLQRIRKG